MVDDGHGIGLPVGKGWTTSTAPFKAILCRYLTHPALTPKDALSFHLANSSRRFVAKLQRQLGFAAGLILAPLLRVYQAQTIVC
jgi:hypothetical protein